MKTFLKLLISCGSFLVSLKTLFWIFSVHQEESSQSSESTDLEPIEILPAVNGNVPANSSVPNVPVINVDPLGASLVASTNTVPMATGVITGPDTVPLTLDPSGVPLIASTSGVPIATGVIQGPVTGVVTGPDSVPMVTSVLTGPNTVAMIPTIVNLDFYTKQEPTWYWLIQIMTEPSKFVYLETSWIKWRGPRQAWACALVFCPLGYKTFFMLNSAEIKNFNCSYILK